MALLVESLCCMPLLWFVALHKLGMVKHACSPGTQGIEAGGWEVQSHLLLCSEFEATVENSKPFPKSKKKIITISWTLRRHRKAQEFFTLQEVSLWSFFESKEFKVNEFNIQTQFCPVFYMMYKVSYLPICCILDIFKSYIFEEKCLGHGQRHHESAILVGWAPSPAPLQDSNLKVTLWSPFGVCCVVLCLLEMSQRSYLYVYRCTQCLYIWLSYLPPTIQK